MAAPPLHSQRGARPYAETLSIRKHPKMKTERKPSIRKFWGKAELWVSSLISTQSFDGRWEVNSMCSGRGFTGATWGAFYVCSELGALGLWDCHKPVIAGAAHSCIWEAVIPSDEKTKVFQGLWHVEPLVQMAALGVSEKNSDQVSSPLDQCVPSSRRL